MIDMLLNTSETVLVDRDGKLSVHWNLVITRNWGMIMRICRANMRGFSDSDVEDYAQGAILHVLEKAPKAFKVDRRTKPASPEKYISVIVRNYVRDQHRKACNSKPHNSEIDVSSESAPHYTAGWSAMSADRCAHERRVEASRLTAAIDRLTANERTAINAVRSFDKEGQGARSLGWAHSKLHRNKVSAVEKLRQAMA